MTMHNLKNNLMKIKVKVEHHLLFQGEVDCLISAIKLLQAPFLEAALQVDHLIAILSFQELLLQQVYFLLVVYLEVILIQLEEYLVIHQEVYLAHKQQQEVYLEPNLQEVEDLCLIQERLYLEDKIVSLRIMEIIKMTRK